MSDRTIFVTGAGGFIGGRMVEVFHSLGAGHVRAGMRRWATGARIGRLPVEMVRCDIRNPDEVAKALEGVTHVVHCAVGEHSSTVEGTRILMQGALDAGVKRVVHLSTIDVYGEPEGLVSEDTPIASMGKPYGDSKIEAEKAVQEAVAKGLHVTILRPTLVHGPFSGTWTMAYAQRLQKRPWLVNESDAQGTCNLVYVDDLVGATLAAFDAETESGSAYNINGPERPTWHEYWSALNDAMGLPPLVSASSGGSRLKSAAVLPFRKAAKFGITHFQKQIMGLAQSSQLARKAMLFGESLIKTTPVPSEYDVYRRKVSYATDKAEAELGYTPRFPIEVAVPLAAGWLEHNGFVQA